MLPFDLHDRHWQVPADVVGVGEPFHDHWRCPRCGATWFADAPEWCGWCCRRWVSGQLAQRALDLTPPEWWQTGEGWRGRLERAVEAGRVTPDEAARVVRRWMRG